MNEDACEGDVSTAEAFADGLQVRHDVFVLPCVHLTGATHAAHDFVEDEQRAVPFADGFNGLEVAIDGGYAA